MEMSILFTVLGEPQFEDGAVFVPVSIGIAGGELTACIAGRSPAEICALLKLHKGDVFQFQGQLIGGRLASEEAEAFLQ